MKIRKYVRDMTVTHLNGDTDNITELAPTAFDQFEHYAKMDVGDGKIVPYHAVEYVVTSVEQQVTSVGDDSCVRGCGAMDDPSVIAPTSKIEVDAGEEFDPMVGVSAYDDNGESITVTVTYEEAVEEEALQNENSVDLLDENGNTLLNG